MATIAFPTEEGLDAGRWAPTGTGLGHHWIKGTIKAAKPWKKVTVMQDKAAEAGFGKKKIAAAYKEGGKKGVEIEGAGDLSGLEFFCTRSMQSGGELELLEVVMEGMNAEPEPGTESEERKGCSGHIGKVIIGESEEKKQVCLVCYISEDNAKVSAKDWIQGVLDTELGGGMCGEIQPGATDLYCTAICKEDPEKGYYFLKMKDTALTAAITWIKDKGLFPDEDSDDDDENYSGDFEW